MLYYVYRITCSHPKSKEKYYYGYRSCENPFNDVYWSSSKYVKMAIKEYGIEYFHKKILRIFNSKNEAMDFEMKTHDRLSVDINPLFFNRYKASRSGYNGSYLRGKSYEEIHGIEKAKKLKIQRSISGKGKNNKGWHNPMYGRKHSEEMKRNLSEARKADKHPTYGWRWISNGTDVKKINPKSESLPDGWFFGRPSKCWNNRNQYSKID